MGITIKQIAELAGVSRGTVDRAIHGRCGVDSEVKSKIDAIIKELEYTPNTVAKALKKAQSPLNIGHIITSPKSNPFYADIDNGVSVAQKAFSSHGVKVKRKYMLNPSEREQIRYIGELEEEGIDALVIAPIDSVAVEDRLSLIAQKIPIITYNTDINDLNRLCSVGHNHIAAGRSAGELMGKSVKREGSVAVFVGRLDMLAHVQRVQGFWEVITQRYPNLHATEVRQTCESDTIGFKLAMDALHEHDDLVGIYATASGQIGIADALAMSPRKDEITMVCFDLIPPIVNHVKAGVIDYTIGQEPFVQGYMPIKLMYEYIVLDVKPKMEHFYTHIDIKVRDSVDFKGFEIFTDLL